ncbi:HGxxPAAW family protein [Streptomyces sp. 4F14]|uniref:HGxxPAAW family protein n=1 Tax=Streptomyces sp. 4F14 TaxID=3394380 RepID=UPI003A861C48
MAGSSHGHTLAAWTGATICFIGFCVAGAFMVMAEPLGFWAGMVIAVLGGGVGLVMKGMGLGQPKGFRDFPDHVTYGTPAKADS